MSFHYVQRAWETSCDSLAEKLLLVALSDHANPTGHCYPGLERLAERTGLDLRKASDAECK